MAMCPPPGLLPRSQDFESLWQLSTQIGDGGQGQIYKTYPTKLNSKYYSSIYNNHYNDNHGSLRSRSDIERNDRNTKFVTKIIKLKIFGRGGRERIVNHYTFVQKYKLLNIYGIYHDHLNKQILIVMQYLQHELDINCLIDNCDAFNSRFSRPGHIYINSEESLKIFMKQITKQLDVIHSNNRIHFDLKPQNIMFNAEENKWCIIDYDLMKCMETNTNKGGERYYDGVAGAGSTGDPCNNHMMSMELDHYRGTQSWTSPEMKVDANRDRPNIITTKTDIFSFGLIILFIVENGYQPYLLEEKDVEGHCRVLVERPTWRRRKVYYDKLMRKGKGNEYLQNYLHSLYLDYMISDDLFKLLTEMLQFDVNKRFNCKQILNDPWLSNIP